MQTDTLADFTFEAEEIDTQSTSIPIVIPTQTQPNYTDFIKHTYILQQGTWASTLTGNTVIGTDIMNDFLVGTASGNIGAKLKNFRYFTSDIKISIVVQGYTFAYGKLVFWFDPYPFAILPGAANASVPAVNSMHLPPQKCRSMLIPHISIDPSKTQVYELILKCPTISQVYSVIQRTGSYRYGYCVINPLGSGQAATVPPVNFVMHMSLANPQMSSLSYTSGSFTEKEQTKVSDHAFSISQGLSYMSKVPVLGSFATLASEVSYGVGLFLSWFGFSKPVVQTKDNMFLAYTCDETTVMDGKLHAMTLAGRHNNTVTINPKDIPGSSFEDQMLDNIAGRLGFYQTITFASTNVYGDLLATIPLDMCRAFVTDSPVVANGYEPLPMTTVSRLYDKWRCDFKIRLEIIASVLHRGTIVVAYFPDPTSAVATVIQATQTVRCWEFQIAGNAVHDLEIAYSQLEPFQDNSIMQASTIGTFGISNGFLKIYVMNPNVSNTTTPIYINVYLAACNMKLGVPSNKFTVSPTFQFTSGPVAPSTTSNKVCIEDPTFFKSFFGEEQAHTMKEAGMRAVKAYELKTTDQMLSNTYNLITPSNFYAKLPTGSLFAAAPLTAPNNNLTWILGSYVGYKGSINWSYYLANGRAYTDGLHEEITMYECAARIAYAPSSTYGLYQPITNPGVGYFDNYAFISTYNRNQNFVSVKSPYYYKGYYQPSFPVPTGASPLLPHANQLEARLNAYMSAATTTPGYDMSIYAQLGDDANLVWFRGTPVVVGQ